jgi:hypothetical protein
MLIFSHEIFFKGNPRANKQRDYAEAAEKVLFCCQKRIQEQLKICIPLGMHRSVENVHHNPLHSVGMQPNLFYFCTLSN